MNSKIMSNKEIIELADKVKENAYSPYSKFKVGAVIIGNNNEVFVGCNVENASFGVTNCAERTALFSGVAKGVKKFSKIGIMSSSEEFTFPCGICRQALFEFMSEDGIVILSNKNRDIKEYTIKELLPYGFKL